MPRTFVAVRPPPAVVEHLLRIPRADESARWVPAHQWHVTLQFWRDGDVAAIRRDLDGAVMPAATATLGPRVELLGRDAIVVPVDGLDELAARIRRATAGSGADERRPFRGHLTLGRLRRGERSVTAVGAAVHAGFEVHEVELVVSDLGAAGATHRTTGRWVVPAP